MSSTTAHTLTLSVASAILIAGLIDDLRSRKVHNWLFLSSAIIGFLTALFVGGGQGVVSGLLGFGTAIALLLPLVLFKALGAGDMKILAAFGLVTTWETVLHVTVYSLIWGAIFGVLRVLIKGDGIKLLKNIGRIILRKKSEVTELHTIPYTAALLVGWLTYLTYEGVL